MRVNVKRTERSESKEPKQVETRDGQATKGLRWIPRHREAMKDVVTYDKLRGAGSKR